MVRAVQECARMCKNVQECAIMYNNVKEWARMCNNVQECIKMCISLFHVVMHVRKIVFDNVICRSVRNCSESAN
jgi:hypothetical protein